MAKINSPDFYAILGVSEKAGNDELREAYLRLAKKYHPDKNPGHPQYAERFKSISEAYAVLREAQTRARYDRLRRKMADPKARSRKAARTAGRPAGPGPAAGPAQPKTQAAPKAQAASKAQAAPKSQPVPPESQPRPAPPPPRPEPRTEPNDSQLDKFLYHLFKTRTGRTSLKELHEELAKAGLAVPEDRLSRHILGRGSKLSLWERMTGAVRGFLFPASAKPPQPAGASPAGASPDINYRLAVSPKAAAEGTTISINYLRDGSQNHRLTVTIPPGIKDQGLLRLSGQGHLGPNQKRGDLLLTVLIIS